MITKEDKKQIVDELADKFSRQKVAIFSDYTGLNVNRSQELRSLLRENDVDYRVAKKTLIDLALKQAGIEGINIKGIEGQISVAFGYDDEVNPVKLMNKFAKDSESMDLVAGLLGDQYLSAEQVNALAKMPSREEMMAKVVGSISAPLSGLVNSLQGNLRSLVYILSNIKSEA